MKKWDNQLAIILPTFNESQNLRVLLNKIKKNASNAILIVVDDSIETEKTKIKKISKSFKKVQVISRKGKLGRGNAVLDGFRHVLQNKDVIYFVEMDTDLAHDPKELPQFYEAIQKEKAQLVIGSRYLTQSNIINWPFRRLILSKLINFFLNQWLGLKLHDYTNGYRMYTRKAVEHLVKKGLHEKNFITLSESAFLLKQKKMKIIEIPITFTDRKHGISSVGVKELVISLCGAVRIRFRN